MDSYLTRFESYALSNKWDPSMWASYLSALLKRRALEVFVRLSRDNQSDYGQIKEALLTNFDLTERSFRKKFRDCRPEKAETFRQFSGRLASYLDKWLGLAKVEKAYEAICDFLAQDQFLDCCSHELYLYLKPKTFKVLGELDHEADLFADARVEFLDASQKGIVRLRVMFRIITEIRLIENQIFLVRFVLKPIKHIIVGTTRARGCRLVRK